MVPGSGGVVQSDLRGGGASRADLLRAKREAGSGVRPFKDNEFSFHIRRYASVHD